MSGVLNGFGRARTLPVVTAGSAVSGTLLQTRSLTAAGLTVEFGTLSAGSYCLAALNPRTLAIVCLSPRFDG